MSLATEKLTHLERMGVENGSLAGQSAGAKKRLGEGILGSEGFQDALNTHPCSLPVCTCVQDHMPLAVTQPKRK